MPLALLRRFWQRLRDSLWFISGLLVLGAGGRAYGLIEFDSRTSFDGPSGFRCSLG